MRIQKYLGTLAILSLIVMGSGMAHAQTTTPTYGTGSTTTPGAPNTGAGGDATTNTLLLGGATLLMVGSGIYLSRKVASQ